jgi:epoxyqueuosine reductase
MGFIRLWCGPVTTPQTLTAELKREAAGLGFALAGACPAVTPGGLDRFYEWLDAGYGGQMHYLQGRRQVYEHPRHVLGGATSLLVVALPYRSGEPHSPGPGEGRVSRYAWGIGDYHDLIHDRLRRLARVLVRLAPEARFRGVVDTAPLLEREFAQLAGLGWIGKNTLLLNPQLGSWFFLAALLTDQMLEYDEPFTQDHCGTCRACLDACPTNAFVAPYVLDATRCISYLTIELRDAIPPELRAGLGDWIFGCDVCQDVCPWNHHAPVSLETAFAPRGDLNPAGLTRLFELDDDAFRHTFRATPLWRAKRRGILRNASIVLGNQRVQSALPILERAAVEEDDVVREACRWAIGRIKM